MKGALFALVCLSAFTAPADGLDNPALNPVEHRAPTPETKPWAVFEKGRARFQVLVGPGGGRAADAS